MPDQYRFDHLGDTVRCIDCPSGGPIWQWPEQKRARHARGHGIASQQRATDVRRQRVLLAAPPTDSNEEKEGTTMATTEKKGEPAKQVAIDVLRKAGQPLHAKEVAKRVLASGRCAGLKGKTPEATISAMLAVGSKPGGPFRRVGKGTYALADTASAPATSAQQEREQPAKDTSTRTAPAAKPKRQGAKPKRQPAKRRTATKRSR